MGAESVAAGFQTRWSGRWTTAAAAAWFAICVALTLGPFRTHIEYFGERLSDLYQWAIVGTLAVLGLWTLFYLRLRASGLWKWEPRFVMGLALTLFLLAAPFATLTTLLLASVCYASGALLLNGTGFRIESPVDRLALGVVAGMGLLSLVLIPIGLSGLYGAGAFWGLTALMAVAARKQLMELPAILRAVDLEWQSTPALRSPAVGVLIAFAPAFIAAFVAAATAPAIAYDPVSHHMPAARHYLEGGLLEPLPLLEGVYEGRWLFSLGHSVAYSYYPQTFEELLAFSWGLGGQSAAQLVSPLSCLLAMLLVVAIGRQCGLSRAACIVGVGAGFSLPFAHWVGAISKNDYPLAIFQLAALYAALRARADGGSRWLLLGSAMLGLSFGVKHTTLFLAIPIGLLMLWELRNVERPLRLIVAMASLFFLAGFFWHARTFVLTGNPLFPADITRGMSKVPAIDGTRPSRWTVHLLYPWYAHFDGIKVMEGPTDSPAGFFLLFFWPLWLLVRRRRPPAEAAVLFSLAVFYLYWAYIWGVLRYGLAPALLLAVLVSARVLFLADKTVWLQRLSAGALAYCLAFGLLPVLMLEVNAPQLAYLAGKLDKEAYLREAMADYGAVAFLNGRQQAGERVFSINNCSSAYATDPARFRCLRYDHAFEPRVVEAIRGAVTASQPAYIVLPADERGDLVLQALGRDFGDPIYADDAFRVHARLD